MTSVDRALNIAQQQIGREVGVSGWITVDQAMIDTFADVSGDSRWIDMYAEQATPTRPHWWRTGWA